MCACSVSIESDRTFFMPVIPNASTERTIEQSDIYMCIYSRLDSGCANQLRAEHGINESESTQSYLNHGPTRPYPRRVCSCAYPVLQKCRTQRRFYSLICSAFVHMGSVLADQIAATILTRNSNYPCSNLVQQPCTIGAPDKTPPYK